MTEATRLLKAFRARTKEFKPLSRDPWIRTNSDVEPQKLHALGVITFRWNLSENKLFGLFVALLKRPVEEAHTLAHDLGDMARIERIKMLAAGRIKQQRVREVISNVLDVYDVCRRNRNQLTHFGVTLVAAEPDGRLGLALARKIKSPVYQKDEPFPDTVKDIRRVARDIRQLNNRLLVLVQLLHARRKRGAAKAPPLPKTLPVPEPLWKPPRQGPKARQSRQQSSRA